MFQSMRSVLSFLSIIVACTALLAADHPPEGRFGLQDLEGDVSIRPSA